MLLSCPSECLQTQSDCRDPELRRIHWYGFGTGATGERRVFRVFSALASLPHHIPFPSPLSPYRAPLHLFCTYQYTHLLFILPSFFPFSQTRTQVSGFVKCRFEHGLGATGTVPARASVRLGPPWAGFLQPEQSSLAVARGEAPAMHSLESGERPPSLFFFPHVPGLEPPTRFATRRLDGAREGCMCAHKRLTSLAAVTAICDLELKIWTVAPLGLRPQVLDVPPPPLANSACPSCESTCAVPRSLVGRSAKGQPLVAGVKFPREGVFASW